MIAAIIILLGLVALLSVLAITSHCLICRLRDSRDYWRDETFSQQKLTDRIRRDLRRDLRDAADERAVLRTSLEHATDKISQMHDVLDETETGAR